jgi:ribosomal protein L37AE/L43A
MKMNRVQFQAGLSMAEYLKQFGTEEQCASALEASRWPDGWRCPHCGDQRHSLFYREGRKYWQCHRCREQTSLISGTIFQATKLPLTRWFLAMHLLTQSKNNVSALEMMRHLGVCYKTAWLMKHKLLEVMFLREAPRMLDGRVEVDDAYLGGERPGKRGRGSENKVSFIAAVQTNAAGHPHTVCLKPLLRPKWSPMGWAASTDLRAMSPATKPW